MCDAHFLYIFASLTQLNNKMIYINLPPIAQRSAVFYLAMEEFVAANLPSNEYLSLWRIDPTVLLGRNQLADSEVNHAYCEKEGIAVYRRKSGGGCVYSDQGNVMFSLVCPAEESTVTFAKLINGVSTTLQSLGIPAIPGGRNDIHVDGKKVSGCAFYRCAQNSVAHCTLIYETDVDHIVHSLTPATTKLESKGVNSVRQRIGMLKDYTTLSQEDIMKAMKTQLCDGEITLKPDDIEKIEAIEKVYLDKNFIYGKNPQYTYANKKRIEGVGELDVKIEVKHNVIKEINLLGDFFLLGDLDNELLLSLKNVDYEEEAIRKALPERLDNIIMNLNKEDFIRLIINQ